MPSILLPNKALQKSPLQGESVQSAVQLASSIQYHHDSIKCDNCDKIANYYILGFHLTKQQPMIVCNALLLTLVQQTSKFFQRHLDMSRTRRLPWMSVLINEMRELGKRIKDESLEVDRLVLLPISDQEEETDITSYSLNEAYGRAIRITLYHCRASLYEDVDLSKSISYYRKCVSVRPSQFESQKLQHAARVALQHLIADYTHDQRPRLPSRTSSVSSGASSSSMSCGNCGIEKRGMPVCSRCKSQSYCSIRCLKAHKPIHECQFVV
ncbi:uncharacterized protein B0P05DRAFT_215582 [Gilbertella persicaria]|uniref:uncharacterized protein n=1 Tax=Gilbertella persicaria TaxID=101096 RepID=UPI0022205B13|nr:uncharacterized protein B0P05DRAFT_215582 [Gilbertella persicaria]KAI8065384.1 hypothetical protein B0P05DRAFT_215582 [Gilbertella persicaria]